MHNSHKCSDSLIFETAFKISNLEMTQFQAPSRYDSPASILSLRSTARLRLDTCQVPPRKIRDRANGLASIALSSCYFKDQAKYDGLACRLGSEELSIVV